MEIYNLPKYLSKSFKYSKEQVKLFLNMIVAFEIGALRNLRLARLRVALIEFIES